MEEDPNWILRDWENLRDVVQKLGMKVLHTREH